jgi:hypothetical protein
MKLYTQLLPFFKEIAPTWRKTQLVNLALLASALFQKRRFLLSELARAYPIPARRKVSKPKHGLVYRVKRLWRFLDNDRLDEDGLMQRLIRLSYSACRTPGTILPILVDLTYFDPFAVLSASIPQGGRALPIAWRTFFRNLEGERELSQNLIIDNVLKKMTSFIAPGVEPVIIADREFARASLFRFLKTLNSHFVIRIDAETWVLHPQYTGPLGSIGIRSGGRRIWLSGALYGKEEQEPINLLAVWEVGQKEPWLIATDLDDPKLVERLYRKRMKIEHGFRDWKHHLRLKGTPKVKSAKHLNRLLTGVVVLYWYLCLLGTRLNRKEHRAEVTCWGRLSHFKLALELVELGHQAVLRAGNRLLLSVADKLLGLSPPTPTYKLRYLRFRRKNTGPQTSRTAQEIAC